MKYLLDTDTCIYLIKKKPLSVLKKFETKQLGDIGISSVTLAELMHGVEKSQHAQQNKNALEEFLLPLEIFSFDTNAAYHYGAVRAYLEQKGTPIGALDLMIAAQALSIKSVVVTNNLKEFTRVPGLSVENWVS
jgi:tRNA(fMet)-specific endonuclease VapC